MKSLVAIAVLSSFVASTAFGLTKAEENLELQCRELAKSKAVAAGQKKVVIKKSIPRTVVTGPILGYNPGEGIYCDFEPTEPSGHSTTYIHYDGHGNVRVEYFGTDPSSWAPIHWVHHYAGVEIVTDIAPLYNDGFAIAPFAGEVPLVHLQPGNATKWNERGSTYPFFALWGNQELQGSPTNPNFLGVCSTDSLPAVKSNSFGR